MNFSDINFNYSESKNQTKLFTPSHTRFVISISYNGEHTHFDYQCNKRYEMPTVESCLVALYNDAIAYENCHDLIDFMAEYGYTDKIVAKASYNACKRHSEALNRLFGDGCDLYEILEPYF